MKFHNFFFINQLTDDIFAVYLFLCSFVILIKSFYEENTYIILHFNIFRGNCTD